MCDRGTVTLLCVHKNLTVKLLKPGTNTNTTCLTLSSIPFGREGQKWHVLFNLNKTSFTLQTEQQAKFLKGLGHQIDCAFVKLYG
jgi:hypothetical protein